MDDFPLSFALPVVPPPLLAAEEMEATAGTVLRGPVHDVQQRCLVANPMDIPRKSHNKRLEDLGLPKPTVWFINFNSHEYGE